MELLLASKVGKTDRVCLLMQLKADVNFQDDQDVSYLMTLTLFITPNHLHKGSDFGAFFRTIEHHFTGQLGMPM
jgi:hypothetical protein